METPCRIDPVIRESSDDGDVVNVVEDREAQEPLTAVDEAEAAERVKCAVVAMPLGRVTHRKYFKSYADAKYHEFVVLIINFNYILRPLLMTEIEIEISVSPSETSPYDKFVD